MSYFLNMSIKDILIKNKFNYKKSFGQNFITDDDLLEEIVNDSGITKDDVVIEIGAGAGTLTSHLCMRAKKVIAFEIDKQLQTILNESLKGYSNYEIVFSDIMKMRIQDINDLAGGSYKVVANLPYYITTPIIMFFMENNTPIQSMSIMVQKEVADRLVAREGNKDYGAITVAINAFADTKITRIVDRRIFYPVPNVDSAVVRIDMKHKYDIENIALFRKIYKCAFAMRRKTLVNNLINSFSFERKQAEELIESVGLDVAIRGEALSLDDFYNLYTKLF